MNYCKCGCKVLVRKTWKKGHHWRLRKTLTKEHREKVSKALLGHLGYWMGKKFSKEHREKIGKALRGRSYGVGKKLTQVHRQHISDGVRRVLEERNGIGHLGYKTSIFESGKNDLSIMCESSYERQACENFEIDDFVESYRRCNFSIPYYFDKIKFSYYPDFIVNYIDNTKKIIEIKPKRFLMEKKNKQKFDAAKKWCKNNGYSFDVQTEHELGFPGY